MTAESKPRHPILVFLSTKQTALVGAVPKTLRSALTWESIVQTVAMLLEQPGYAGDQLRACSPQSVYASLLDILNKGLDISLKEAFLIPYKGECTPMISAAGKITLAYRSGLISKIVCQLVYESDTDFEIDLANGTVKHPMTLEKLKRIATDGRGDMLACYARIWVKGSEEEPVPELMTIDQFQRIAEEAQRKGGGKISPAYRNFPDEMFRRSCLNRALKRAPKSRDLAEILNRETELEEVGEQESTPSNSASNDSVASLPDYGDREEVDAELERMKEPVEVKRDVVENEPPPKRSFTDDLPTPQQLRNQIEELEKNVPGPVMAECRKSVGVPPYKPLPTDLPADKLTQLRDALKARVLV